MKALHNLIARQYLRRVLPLLLFLVLSSCTSCKKTGSSTLPEVETVDITTITAISALSGGRIIRDGGSDIIERGVCWGEKTGPTVSDTHTTDGSGNSDYESTLTQLKPETTYYVKAFARNSEGVGYGNEKTFITRPAGTGSQIIADHTVVDQFDKIPQQYIDEVKKMWISIAGESHSQAYRTGLTLLSNQYPSLAVSVSESGTPEGPTSSHLRASRATWGDVTHTSGWIYDYGEEDWFTSSTAISRTKASLLYSKNSDLGLSVFGFGWCYDGTYPGVDGSVDALYGTRWGGATVGSPQGERVWGLDAGDQSLTGNSVSMQTYIDATNDYINYCASNNIQTKVIFTTGPVDTDYIPGLNSGEIGYQQYLKWEYIRDYVKSNPSTILFDYADILSYNNAGQLATTSWENRNGVNKSYPLLHPDNLSGSSVGHIGSEGAIRLAKAMWWMLARITGWDGS